MKVGKRVVNSIDLRANRIWKEEKKPPGQALRHWLWAKWQVRHSPLNCDLDEFVAEAMYHAYQVYERSGGGNGHDLADWYQGWLQSLLYHLPSGLNCRRMRTFFFYEGVDVEGQIGQIRSQLQSSPDGIDLELCNIPGLLLESLRKAEPDRKTVYFIPVAADHSTSNELERLLQHLCREEFLWHTDSELVERMTGDMPHLVNRVALDNPSAAASAIQLDFYCC